ncbi:MAG: hypothetical protein ACT4OF_10305 [Caulobacteraceae bacterium]
MKLPTLTPVAKAQLWGMAVGFALALLATERMGLSYGIFLVGGAAAWVASERWLAPRLIGSDVKTLSLAILSGMAFPWVGWLAAFLLQQLRP